MFKYHFDAFTVFVRMCCMSMFVLCVYQEEKDQQWKQAMDYLSAVTELNYMTQIVIMLYEDNNKVSLHRAVLLHSKYFLFNSALSALPLQFYV